MAARENQGLQISLIVFVFFTVVLSLTTFVFFRNSQNESKRADEAAKSDSTTKQQLSKVEQEREDLAKWIGHAAADKHEAISDRWTKDMAAFQTFGIDKAVPEEQRNYLKLVESLHGVIRTQYTQLAKKDADLREAKTTYETKTAEYEAERAKLTAEKEKALADYATERTRINNQVGELTVSKTQLAADKTAKDTELARLKVESDTKVGKLNEDLSKMQKQVLLKADEVKELKGEFDINAHPSGKVTWVNQRDKLAYINLGSDDRLRKRVTFTVFDPSTTDVSALPPSEDAARSSANGQIVSQARKKGVIEVINITGAHMAECRILEHSPSNPLLPGDVIYTPLWRAGQQEHFAIVGFLDIDGDNTSDRSKVHDLIRINGGVIDAEVDDKGNVNGAITHQTRYLIRGSSEDRKGVSSASGGGSVGGVGLMSDAEKFGVDVISLAKFLDLMGYKPLSQDELNVSGRVPQPPTAGEPTDNFRARTPPTRGSNGGAY